MINNSVRRRREWTDQMVYNKQFCDEYRKTGYMNNYDHLQHHEHRREHTDMGELGVLNRTYLTSQDRANQQEKYFKSLQNPRWEWSEKRSLAN